MWEKYIQPHFTQWCEGNLLNVVIGFFLKHFSAAKVLRFSSNVATARWLSKWHGLKRVHPDRWSDLWNEDVLRQLCWFRGRFSLHGLMIILDNLILKKIYCRLGVAWWFVASQTSVALEALAKCTNYKR